MQAGDFAMAEQICRNSLDMFPRDANLLVLLGAALVKLEKPEDAEHTLSRAAKMFPDFSRAHEGLAEAFIMQGKLPAATKKSVAKKPRGRPIAMPGGAQKYHGPDW